MDYNVLKDQMIVFLKVKCGLKVLYFELCGDMDEAIPIAP